MSLEAMLTVGWPEVPSEEEDLAAVGIHKACACAGKEKYGEKLLSLLGDLRQKHQDKHFITLKGTEQLFRRRANGFGDIKEFMGKLNEVVMAHPELGDVRCEIDVFAYAFLKGAKNFDFFLPEAKGKNGPFRTISWLWKKEIATLERFERTGNSPPGIDTVSYLNFRRIISRKSARDERRALATLLVSGPSTRKEITEDLGLPYSLAERILPTLEAVNILLGLHAGLSILRNCPTYADLSVPDAWLDLSDSKSLRDLD